ncbi:ribosomal protein S18-alanine N-acetyltransferase [Niveibacterium sp. SC-1]|uniref:ribosomal protein S18-alanine N-acetyltransferase n=1 Tax=Niveibacterium sp. SC-1 TaxID=3135646 RepID=UPI00311EB11B
MTAPVDGLRFRPLAREDLAWAASVEAHLQAFPWTEKSFGESLDAGHSGWVVCLDEEPVAYLVMMVVIDEAHLLNIGVTRNRHRQGIGRALLREAYGLARQAGALQMFLEVRVSNQSAAAFYEAEGFEQVGRRRGYYPAAHGREDAIVMRRALS